MLRTPITHLRSIVHSYISKGQQQLDKWEGSVLRLNKLITHGLKSVKTGKELYSRLFTSSILLSSLCPFYHTFVLCYYHSAFMPSVI